MSSIKLTVVTSIEASTAWTRWVGGWAGGDSGWGGGGVVWGGGRGYSGRAIVILSNFVNSAF